MLKRCPQCGREYYGEDSFCLDDGTLLLSGPSHSVGVSGDQPTQLVSRNVPSTAVSPARWPFVLIGLLVVVVAALAGALFMRQANGPDDKKTETTDTETVTRPLASPLTVASPVTAASPVQSVPPRPPISPAGQWKGDWSTSSGAYYKFDLALNESDGHVDGQITWTLVRTTRPDKMGMQGMSATEYVRGTFDPASRQVNMRGTSKSDPNGLLVMLDQYRLHLSPDERTLNGSARNGGKWNGTVNLSR